MEKIRWDRLYGMLEGLTPLAYDCGRLCAKNCCSGREEGAGIYLFPGEEKLFGGDEQWCSISECVGGDQYYTGAGSFILSCRGECPREKRPLACRLFPLAPHLDGEGNLEIIMDSDAFFVCPLARLNDPGFLDPAFREGVRRVWSELLQYDLAREGVFAYSARIDRQSEDPWTKLFSR